ncbi:unannotated protein [freshwater metagenome]|uniref:Unannotated protein n=1 Tax=freshwater metagenome TaxID=449393 RepID=A0A6J6WUA3_9ZZZZ
MQQLEHFIEARRVRSARGANREGALEARQHAAAEQRFACTHPVAVALHCVDLAVVSDVAIRMRQCPTWERVGTEAAVHQGQRTLDALVAEVGEEHRQLRRGEHALIDHCPARQRREIRCLLGSKLVLDSLASYEQLAIKIEATGRAGAGVGVGNEQLTNDRHHLASTCTKARRIDWHSAPAKGA